jgi:peptidoglycan/LPS O-acetylase OafA/YrhL
MAFIDSSFHRRLSTLFSLKEDSSSGVTAGYIPQITGVRAIAAYMVYLHHFPTGHATLPSTLFQMTLELHCGVGLFFVLSGFLIYQRYYASYTTARSASATSAWWGNYTKNRIARIYPMYALLTALTLLNRSLRHGDASPWLWFLNLSFLRGFSETYYMSGVSQGWTLTVEECFYFSAPLIFWLVYRWTREQSQPQNQPQNQSSQNKGDITNESAFWLPMLALYALGGVLLAAGELVGFQGFFQGAGFMVSYTYFGRAFEFFCGMCLARLMARQQWQQQPARRFPTFTLTALAGIAAVLYGLSLLQTGAGLQTGLQSVSQSGFHYGIVHPLGKALNNLALPPFYAMLFYGLIRERSVFQRVLASPLMVLLGKSSYIFYLIHMGIVQALIARVVCPTTFTPVTTAEYVAQFLLLNVAAVLLFLAVEDPLNRFIRQRWRLGRAYTSAPQENVI